MKTYVMTTGTIFALIALAHVARLFAESTRLARDPFFVALTLVSAGLSVWAFRLVRGAPHP